ncbi:DUF805 domain-containing protein [Xanthobacteraceae bacterium A53D]
MRSYLAVMRAYARFAGRAGRREFWLYHLVVLLLSLAASGLDVLIFDASPDYQGPFGLAVIAVHLLPSAAVMVRRLHDLGRSGWWLLLAPTGIGLLVLAIFAMEPGSPARNGYGVSPAA